MLVNFLHRRITILQKIFLIILMGGGLGLVSCQAPSESKAPVVSQQRSPNLVASPQYLETQGLEEGTGAVQGRLLNLTGAPLSHVVVRLAKVYYTDDQSQEGIYVLDNAFSPSAQTDHEGRFRFDNVAAGDYVIIVGDVLMKFAVVTRDGDKPLVWTIKAGHVLDTKVLSVDY